MIEHIIQNATCPDCGQVGTMKIMEIEENNCISEQVRCQAKKCDFGIALDYLTVILEGFMPTNPEVYVVTDIYKQITIYDNSEEGFKHLKSLYPSYGTMTYRKVFKTYREYIDDNRRRIT